MVPVPLPEFSILTEDEAPQESHFLEGYLSTGKLTLIRATSGIDARGHEWALTGRVYLRFQKFPTRDCTVSILILQELLGLAVCRSFTLLIHFLSLNCVDVGSDGSSVTTNLWYVLYILGRIGNRHSRAVSIISVQRLSTPVQTSPLY